MKDIETVRLQVTGTQNERVPVDSGPNLLTCLRLYCPALPADTGHSDGCAAANRGASGDGLRPAGADTPGSGVTAGLCQCHDSVTAYEFACYNQGWFSWPISVLFGSPPNPP